MEKSILRHFTKYVSFNILGMIGISCYILADTYFIAKALGATGIAALNLSISIYSLIHGVGLMLGIGGATRFSICILLFHFVRKKNKLVFLKNKIVWSLIPDLFSLGLSAFIIEVSSAVVLITFNLVILDLEGNLGVAAYGIIANLALVGSAVFTGLAQGMQPLISKYYGLKKYEMVRKVCKYALLTAALIAITIYLGVFLYSDTIVSIFNNENNIEIAKMAKAGLRIYFLGFFFAGGNIVIVMFLSATENARNAFIISIIRGFVIIIPLVLVLSKVWNMTGIWFAFVFTELIVTIIALYLASARNK